jgi:hypothetical protein
MRFDLMLILATVAIMLSPYLIEAWMYREPHKPRKAENSSWTTNMTS